MCSQVGNRRHACPLEDEDKNIILIARGVTGTTQIEDRTISMSCDRRSCFHAKQMRAPIARYEKPMIHGQADEKQ